MGVGSQESEKSELLKATGLCPPTTTLAPSTKICESMPMNTALEILSHIVIDDSGRAWIDDSNVKVIEVARDHIAYGWSPEEIHWQYPHLGLAQIYAALAHYHDNRAAMDAEIESSLKTANAAAVVAADSPIARRLRSLSRE